jgi:hypothetical protein
MDHLGKMYPYFNTLAVVLMELAASHSLWVSLEIIKQEVQRIGWHNADFHHNKNNSDALACANPHCQQPPKNPLSVENYLSP